MWKLIKVFLILCFFPIVAAWYILKFALKFFFGWHLFNKIFGD